MKANNLHNILKYIIKSKAISRADIARDLELTKATVSYLTNQLEDLCVIVPQKELKKTNGRYSVLYELNKNYGHVISINVKPQNLLVYITLINGDLVFEEKIDRKITDSDTLLSTLKEILENLLKKYPNNIGVGIGIHGTVDNNSIINFTPYNNIRDFDLKSNLQSIFPFTNFYIANEANVTSLGESTILDEDIAVTITNGKGIGGGLIINHNVYTGSKGFAGEIGHIIVEHNGLPCPCGNLGCLEQYSSEENILVEISKIKGIPIDALQFIELYKSGDLDVISVYLKSLDYLSIAINTIINLLNPNSIVLNGYLYKNIDSTIEYLKTKLGNQVDKLALFTTSSNGSSAFPLGFTNIIVKNYFIIDFSWDK